jgi:SAM-dependent methyltransferase
MDFSKSKKINKFDEKYYLDFGHKNDNIGIVYRHLTLLKKYFQKILVVPCGYGQIVHFLNNGLGKDCYGLDVSESMYLRRIHENVKLGDVREYDLQNNEFDLVINVDLLEHFMENEIDIVLDKINKSLKEDGVLIIRVGTDTMNEFHDDPTHITKKSERWWMKKITEHGFYPVTFLNEIGEYVFTKRNIKYSEVTRIFKTIDDDINYHDEMWNFNFYMRRREDGRWNYIDKFRNIISFQTEGKIDVYLDSGYNLKVLQGNEIVMMDLEGGKHYD